MRFPGFIGGSYTLQSVNVDCQRCVNLYPEKDEQGTGNEGEVASLVSTPGLKLLLTLPNSPVRGLYCDSQGQLWAVAGNQIFQISSSWVATQIGTLVTFSGPVAFADNGQDAVVVDGTYGYTWSILNTPNFFQIVDPSFYGANTVTFMDSYLIFNKPNTNVFYFSGQNAISFNGLDAASAEAAPEPIVGLVALQENIYILSKTHLEVWYDSGANSNPFARIQGSVIEVGCAAAQTIVYIQTAVYWLARDQKGQGMIYRIQGLQSQRISTYPIETIIRDLGVDLSLSRAYAYQQGGHYFYVINFPGATSTWVFDATLNVWHERTYLGSDGNDQRHRADCHAYAFLTNVVGDYQNGNVYALDYTTYTDNGNPIRRERTTPHLSIDLNRIFHQRFLLDMERGVGLDGTGQGTDPQAMLQWSDDFGNSWSNEHWRSIGKIGERRQRIIWRRLGQARDRVYRVRITDPVKVTLLGAEIDFEAGSS